MLCEYCIIFKQDQHPTRVVLSIEELNASAAHLRPLPIDAGTRNVES